MLFCDEHHPAGGAVAAARLVKYHYRQLHSQSYPQRNTTSFQSHTTLVHNPQQTFLSRAIRLDPRGDQPALDKQMHRAGACPPDLSLTYIRSAQSRRREVSPHFRPFYSQHIPLRKPFCPLRRLRQISTNFSARRSGDQVGPQGGVPPLQDGAVGETLPGLRVPGQFLRVECSPVRPITSPQDLYCSNFPRRSLSVPSRSSPRGLFGRLSSSRTSSPCPTTQENTSRSVPRTRPPDQHQKIGPRTGYVRGIFGSHTGPIWPTSTRVRTGRQTTRAALRHFAHVARPCERPPSANTRVGAAARTDCSHVSSVPVAASANAHNLTSA